MIPAINKDINSLNPNFRRKFDAWRMEVLEKYPNAVVFETRRSQERQNRLYAQGRYAPYKEKNIVTRTLDSNHRDGNAVDIVFNNNGVIQWAGPYGDLITMAKKYGIRNLAPKELCHFEDDGTAYIPKPASTVPGMDLSAEDTAALLDLEKDNIRNGDFGTLDHRTMVIMARVYRELKKKIDK